MTSISSISVDMMSVLVFILVTILCYVNVLGQDLNATIIPKGSDGANPVIAAVVNATNVEFYCRVTRDGALRQTQWTLIRPGMSNTIITFQLNGAGNVGFENFFVEDNVVPNSRTNFTIIEFYSTFDNTQIGCGSGGQIAARFDLKLISMSSLHHYNVYIINIFRTSHTSSSVYPTVCDREHYLFI